MPGPGGDLPVSASKKLSFSFPTSSGREAEGQNIFLISFYIIQSDSKQTGIFEMAAILLWFNLCKKSNGILHGVKTIFEIMFQN